MNRAKIQTLILTGVISACAVMPTKETSATTLKLNKERVEQSIQLEETNQNIEVLDDYQKFRTVNDLNGFWNYRVEDNKVILGSYIGSNLNTKVEIPRTIEGMSVELESLKHVLPGVTHVKTAEGSEMIGLQFQDLGECFRNNKTIRYVDLRGIDTSQVRSMFQMFRDCTNVEYVNMEGLDVRNLTNLEWSFYQTPSLRYVNFSGWDLPSNASNSGAYNAVGNLDECVLQRIPNRDTYNKLIGIIGNSRDLTLDIGGSDLRNGSSLNGLFNNRSGISTIKGLGDLNIEGVTNMGSMFRKCASLTSIEGLEKWDTASVTVMGDMFDGCTSITDFSPIYEWNTQNVTMMNGMFLGCNNITSLDLSAWNTDNVTNLNGTFMGCSNLEEIKGTENWSLSSLTEMNQTFRNCPKLKVIDLSSFAPNAVPNRSNTFALDGTPTEEEKRLLVVSDNQAITGYNFGSNRVGHTITIDENGGNFTGNDRTKTRILMTPQEFANIDATIGSDIASLGTVSREGYEFLGWKAIGNPEKVSDKLHATYRAEWMAIEINPDLDFDNGMNVVPDERPSLPDLEMPDSDFDSDMGVIPNDKPLEIPDNDFDNGMNVVPEDKPLEIPDEDFDNGMNVVPDERPALPDLEMPDEDFDNGMNVVPNDKPLENPDEDFDADMGVIPEDKPTLPDLEMPDNDLDADMGVVPEDKPLEMPEEDMDADMGVIPEDPTAGDGTGSDNNTVAPEVKPEIPDSDFDSDMEVVPNVPTIPDLEMPDSDLDNDMNVMPEDKPLEVPDEDFDADMGVIPETNPNNPGEDFDSDMNVTPEEPVLDGTHMDNNTVKPELENPDQDFDADMGVVPEEKPPVVEPEVPETPDQPEGEVPPTEDGDNSEEEDTPVTLPEHDYPVQDVLPDDDDLDSDMNVDAIDPNPTPDDDFDSDMNVTPDSSFNHDVLDFIKGEGTENNSYELVVKDLIEINKFNNFLTNELKESGALLLSVSKELDYTLYNFKIVKNARSKETYFTIKIANNKEDIINSFDEFVKETYPTIGEDKFEPALDGTANDNMMVVPEINNTISNNNKPSTDSNNMTKGELPQTGSTAGVGGLLLGISSLLGGLKLTKRNKKK